MTLDTRRALAEGITDAIGFVLGSGTGALVAVQLGFDFLHRPNWDGVSLVGIAFVGLGAGMGRGAARKWILPRLWGGRTHPS